MSPRLHLDALTDSLEPERHRAQRSITLPPGEKTKSFEALQQVVDGILAARLERGDAVIALGGGVIGDLAGFAAGIVRRGMNFVQIPTSLLAQVDSSVGGKTGINTGHGKNLVGVFHQPQLVLADTGVLDTLPVREFRAGYAEVAKYGLIDRPDFFAWLERHWRTVFAGGPERTQAIAESCRAKADVVARDEFETGDRALLNLGHTFGHALEAATGYDSARLVHGEGVAIGMALAHRFSAAAQPGQPGRRGTRRGASARRRPALADGRHPGRRCPTPRRCFSFIAQDKKVSRGALTFILTHGIGQSLHRQGRACLGSAVVPEGEPPEMTSRSDHGASSCCWSCCSFSAPRRADSRSGHGCTLAPAATGVRHRELIERKDRRALLRLISDDCSRARAMSCRASSRSARRRRNCAARSTIPPAARLAGRDRVGACSTCTNSKSPTSWSTAPTCARSMPTTRPEAVVREILQSPHTRMPLWRGSTDNIVGVLHAKDLLRALNEVGNDFARST